jgi:4,5-dihydroxyphthalate decarboxylase
MGRVGNVVRQGDLADGGRPARNRRHPGFVSRVFRHSAIYVANPKIRTPKDLEGKRVGIPEWAQTAGIYVRGLLQHEYGVDLASIDWRQAGVREPGRVEKIQLHLPSGVRIQAMPEHTLAGMLAAGELDAAISARDPGGKRLFPNPRELEAEYYRKTGHLSDHACGGPPA